MASQMRRMNAASVPAFGGATGAAACLAPFFGAPAFVAAVAACWSSVVEGGAFGSCVDAHRLAASWARLITE